MASEYIVTVSRPNLTPEERNRQMERIKRAAERLVVAAAKARKENKA